jgi:hypothetical protein
MTVLFRYKRRWIGWLLTLAMVALTLSANASWQCLDGKPCDPACAMPHGLTSQPISAVETATSSCSHCPTAAASALASIQQNVSDCACTTPQCVLRVAERPASTLQDGVKFFAPLLAMPPPAVLVSPVATETIAVFQPSLCFYPQRFLRPHFGRAPPVLL